MGNRLTTVSAVALAACLFAFNSGGRAAEAATQAAAPASAEVVAALARRIPAIAVGSKSCPPFIARGSMPGDGYSYEIVSDGRRCRVTLFDLDTGLPYMLGTDAGTVVYDLHDGKLWFADDLQLYMQIEPREGSLGTATRLAVELEGTGKLPTQTQFAIRPVVFLAKEQSTIETLPDGRTRLRQRIDDGRIRVIDFAPEPSGNLSFGQIDAATGRYTSYHEWTLDNVAPAPADLTLDLAKLEFSDLLEAKEDWSKARSANPEAPPSGEAVLAALQQYGETLERFGPLARHGGLTQRALGGDAAARKTMGELVPDWDKAAAYDRELRGPWLAGLRTLNVTLRPPTTPWGKPPAVLVDAAAPATQSATAPGR